MTPTPLIELSQQLEIRDEAINAQLEGSPMLTYRAASTAVDAKHRLRSFEEGPYAAYMAHVRKFAKRYIKATNGKDTIEAVRDSGMELFSSERTEDDRLAMAIQLFDAEVSGRMSSKALSEYSCTNEYKTQCKEFYAVMYKYIRAAPPKFYEDIQRDLSDLKRECSKAEALAASFKDRAHCLIAIAANLRAASDIDSFGVGMPVEVANTLREAVKKDPEISPALLSEIARVAKNDARKRRSQ